MHRRRELIAAQGGKKVYHWDYTMGLPSDWLTIVSLGGSSYSLTDNCLTLTSYYGWTANSIYLKLRSDIEQELINSKFKYIIKFYTPIKMNGVGNYNVFNDRSTILYMMETTHGWYRGERTSGGIFLGKIDNVEQLTIIGNNNNKTSAIIGSVITEELAPYPVYSGDFQIFWINANGPLSASIESIDLEIGG